MDDSIIDFLISPVISGLLIMIIIGGIYFEMQTPGVGFPLGAALIAALLYFAPHYLQGLADHWEILIFLAGLILIYTMANNRLMELLGMHFQIFLLVFQ